MSVSNPVVDFWDGENRRIHLKQGVSSFHPIDDIYKEYRNERKVNEDFRKWEPLLNSSGNVNKGGGKATPRYVTMLNGTKIVPFDENYQLVVTGEAITDNPDVDSDIFDTSNLTQPVKVYYAPSEAEIIFLGGTTQTDITAPVWDNVEGIVNAYQNGSTINISWGKASDTNEVSYNIYISKFSHDVYNVSNLLTNTNGYFHTITGIDNESFIDNTSYYIGVRAIDIYGNETTNINYASVLFDGQSVVIDNNAIANAVWDKMKDRILTVTKYLSLQK